MQNQKKKGKNENNIYEKLSKASGKFVKKDDKKNGMHFNPLSHDAVQRVAMKALAEENLYPYCTYKIFFLFKIIMFAPLVL